MLTKKWYLWITVAIFTSFGVGIAHADLYNVALGGTATQSSILGGAGPDRAIDGNTDGEWSHNSVMHTNHDDQAWWQVDLGAEYPIDDITIWNRSGSMDRLTNFTVSVMDGNNTGVWSQAFYTEGGYPNPSLNISLFGEADVITGRHVKVQLNGSNYLHMAEVQVWSTVPEPACILLLTAGGGILLRKRMKTTTR